MHRFALLAGFIFVLSAALAQNPSEVPNGNLLKLGDFCYTITAKQDGANKPIGLTFQRIHRERAGGVDALAVVVHQHLSDGKLDMRDSLLLRRSDLRPIRLDTIRNGKPHVHLDYSPGHVSGWKMVNGKKQPIDVALDGPVWDGNLWGETFAALPLQAGKAYQLPMYQYDRGKSFFYVNAVDKEKYTTPNGSVEAWKLRAGIKQDEQVSYFVRSHERLELGYDAGPSSQHLGGDCSAIR